MAGDQDHLGVRPLFFETTQRLQAVDARQADVQQHGVKGRVGRALQKRFGLGKRFHRVAAADKGLGQALADRGFVVDHGQSRAAS